MSSGSIGSSDVPDASVNNYNDRRGNNDYNNRRGNNDYNDRRGNNGYPRRYDRNYNNRRGGYKPKDNDSQAEEGSIVEHVDNN